MSEEIYKASSVKLFQRGEALVIWETFFYLLTISVAITGNSCVLLAVYRNTRLRTIPNYFIASLAISDILLPLLCAPQSITVVILGRWPFNQDVCQAQGFFVIILACASLQILALTAINRFYRIVRTTHYKRIFTKTKTIRMIALCFIFALLEPLPYLFSGRRYVFHPGKMFCSQTTEISVPNLLVSVFVGVPTFTLSICYFLVFRKIQIHQRSVQSNLQSSSTDEITHRDIKITKILFITVIGFLVCWTPIVVIDVVDAIRGEVTFPRQVYVLYLLLGNMSAVINPFIYGVLNKSFRDEYKKMFFCKRHGRIGNMQESATNSKRPTALVVTPQKTQSV